jgi:hypothetical protein
MCDTQSYPEFRDTCAPDSDANIFDGTEPTAADYIGKHPGTAFMEMQFYPPGWVPWPPGVSCDPQKWCAALTIDSLNQDGNTGTLNNADCLGRVGLEPVSFAFITKSGAPHAAPDPLSVFSPPLAALTPNPATDLFMNSGDVLTVDMHDTAAGFQVVIHDQTTGQSGSMTASVANGFQQVLYEPASATCHEAPYAYHPMYSTSSEHTRVPWPRTPTTSPSRTRSATSSTARPPTRKVTARRRAQAIPAASTATTPRASTRRTRCSSRSEGVSAPTTTSTARPTDRTGQVRDRT